jgi:ABC-2 type transport system permease protein
VNTDPASLVILLGLPAMYLVFFGFGFQSLSGAGGRAGSYLSFLAPGIMAFQAVMAGTVGGSMLWADRRWGMLAQLLVGPFTRFEYLFGIMLTSLLFGLVGAAVMLVIAVALLGTTPVGAMGALAIFGAIALGSIFFGSLMLLISALVKSNNAYNSIQVLLIFFVNFASTVFYPYSSALPAALRVLFVINPLTYIADTARNGYRSALTPMNGVEMLVLALETTVVLVLAIRAYLRSDVSMD